MQTFLTDKRACIPYVPVQACVSLCKQHFLITNVRMTDSLPAFLSGPFRKSGPAEPTLAKIFFLPAN